MAVPTPGGGGVATGPASATSPGIRPPTRRGTELVMLAFAAAIVTGAMILVEANQQQSMSLDILYYGLAYLALFGVAHLAVRRWAPYADPLILPCVALLNGLGLVMIHRLDPALRAQAAAREHAYTDAAPKQLVWTTIGLVLFIAVLMLIKDHRTLARYGYTFGLVGLVLLALPGMLPASMSSAGGAKLWLILGPFSIQPGEFAKILLLIFFAAFLVSKRDLFTIAGRRFLGMDLPRARDLGPLLVACVMAFGVLALENDLGQSLLMFGVVLIMLYVATERSSWIVVGLVLFAAACILAYKLFPHFQVRVSAWLNPDAIYDADFGSSYQLMQGLFGIATGGIFGTGWGAGRPDIVPVSNSDFIVTSFGEELGFIGLAAILMIYLLLVMRGLRGALAVRDTFGKLLAGGLAFSVGVQTFIIVGGVTKLIPLTGITTPFLANGGSSLLANYILVALLLRISDTARRPQASSRPKPPQPAIADQHTVLVERPT
ncbi:FtsW/RodA/SpoVE family cell cycle protein [Solihabitans fulvus]|uniref:FtsW/RodA/SpoVE family cell cycle protein n=1 Tax=Solihabitans fulvus TaxID=1892852 RepID=A0A5B2XKU6_9PSEU|nr:FtsW/RodA/SpoVE family cell cycle protein [Solihabitans fulvus]KAA2263735.1 FtsW/RodA/SpoVE family cell cycle protein [Solihabitans fulvus]